MPASSSKLQNGNEEMVASSSSSSDAAAAQPSRLSCMMKIVGWGVLFVLLAYFFLSDAPMKMWNGKNDASTSELEKKLSKQYESRSGLYVRMFVLLLLFCAGLAFLTMKSHKHLKGKDMEANGEEKNASFSNKNNNHQNAPVPSSSSRQVFASFDQ